MSVQSQTEWRTERARTAPTGIHARFERSLDYRQHYFRKHKGIFGLGIYICPYCGKLVRQHKVEIDHVVPIGKVKRSFWLKVLFFFMGKEGVNSTKNLVAACHKCNRAKSDKGGSWIARGEIGRFLFPVAWAVVPAFLIYEALQFAITGLGVMSPVFRMLQFLVQVGK